MKKKIYLLTFLYFLFGICVNLIHPITASFVRYLNLNDAYFGIFFSTMSIGILVGSLFFGKLSDKIGRSILLPLGLVGYGIFQFCFGHFTSIPLLIIVFRFFSGVSTSAPHTLFLSFVRDIETKENQAKAFSIMSMFYLLGTAIGYKIGGYLYSGLGLSFHQVFLTQSLFCFFLAFLFIISFYKEGKNLHESKKKYASLTNLSYLSKYLIIFLISFMVITMSHTIVTKYIDVFVVDLGYNSNDLGDMVLVSGIVGIISNFVFIQIMRRYKNIRLDYTFVILTLISLISLGFTFLINQAHFIINMYTFYVIFISAKSIMLPVEQTLISKKCEGDSGMVMGLRQSFSSLGQILGPLLATLIYDYNHYYVFYIAMILLIISLILLFIINFRQKKREG